MELAYGPVMMMSLLTSAASTASDVMRPFHPILVNFTAALIPVSLAADLLGAWTRKDALRATGVWTLLAAAVITPFTALAGWLWLASMEHAHGWQMPYHQWLGTAIAAAVIPVAIWRVWLCRRGRGPGWGYGLVGARGTSEGR